MDGGAVTTNVTENICGLLLAPGTVTVISPLYEPAAKFVASTETVKVAAALPEPGDTASQLPPLSVLGTAVQLKVPPPALERLKDWLGGFPDPKMAENEKLPWLTEMIGTLGVTTSCTGIVTGVAPTELISI